MKIVSRWGLAAIGIALAMVASSCSVQSPAGPSTSAGALDRPAPGDYLSFPVDPDKPPATPCGVSLAADTYSAIPFSLPCENMQKAKLTSVELMRNGRGCLTGMTGVILFTDNSHMYSFEMRNFRSSDCSLNGGFIRVCSTLLGGCQTVNIPGITRSDRHSAITAN